MTTNDTVTAYYESLIQKNDDLLKELKKYNVNRISLKEIGRGGFGKVYSFKYSRSNICIKITDPFIKYKENNEENFNDYVSRYNNKINHLK